MTHGFMVDADREKISKSKQSGYEKPQTADAYVKKWGADVLRLWVASQDFRLRGAPKRRFGATAASVVSLEPATLVSYLASLSCG